MVEVGARLLQDWKLTRQRCPTPPSSPGFHASSRIDYGVEHRLPLNGLSQDDIAKEVSGIDIAGAMSG